MSPKIRNIVIFTAIAAASILIYVFFIKSAPPEDNLISLSPGMPLQNMSGLPLETGALNGSPTAGQDFLALLLNIKTIKLNDAIFSDPAFKNLHDSSIILIPDGTEGRPNPFAQFGNDTAVISSQPF